MVKGKEENSEVGKAKAELLPLLKILYSVFLVYVNFRRNKLIKNHAAKELPTNSRKGVLCRTKKIGSTSALDGGEWSASHSTCFNHCEAKPTGSRCFG
jgi:hypothetical protein